jgi:hypothetical protein
MTTAPAIAASRLIAFVLLLAAGGCSLLAAPDAVIPNEPDVGSRDGGGIDGGPHDGGPMDGCVASTELACGDGIDNDCDGLVDCVDYDCAARPQCCSGGGTTTEFDWTNLTGWRPVPAGGFSPQTRDNRLVSFGDDVAAIVRSACQPMELGMQIETTFYPHGTGESFAAIVLTPTDERASNTDRLLDDLAVTVNQQGDVTVTQAGAPLAPPILGFAGVDEALGVTVSITPGLAEEQPAMLATVEIRRNGADATLVLDAHPFLRRTDLIRAPGCERVSGLHVGLEGSAAGVHLGTFRQSGLACADPSHFEAPPSGEDRVLVSQPAPAAFLNLGLGPWAGGGAAAPALVASKVNAASSDIRWDVFVDAADVDRRVELINDIGFSIGHSVSSDSWELWNAPPAPVLGSCHPSCVGMPPVGCTAMCGVPSVREPSVIGVMNSDNVLSELLVAAAQRTPEPPFAYTLVFAATVPPDDTSWAPRPVIFAEAMCDSYRHPSLVPAGPRAVDHGYWLFFTCEKSGDVSEIHAARLQSTGAIAAQPVPVLRAADLGAYAAGGVSAAEVLMQFRTSGSTFDAVYRMWFVARDRGGARVTVGVAQAQVTSQTSVPDPPAFAAYPANPVLPSAAVLGEPCSDCRLTGLAAAQLPEDVHRVRLLVARSVNTAMGLRYELVPMEQDWGDPWRGM